MLRKYISTFIMINQSAHAKFSTSKKPAVLALIQPGSNSNFLHLLHPIKTKDKKTNLFKKVLGSA